MEAIIAGDYRFEPGTSPTTPPYRPDVTSNRALLPPPSPAEEYWANVSDTAKDFVRECLTIDPTSRPTAAEALKHKWLASEEPHFVPDPESPSGRPTNLLPNIRKAFDAKKTCTCCRPPTVSRRAFEAHAFAPS